MHDQFLQELSQYLSSGSTIEQVVESRNAKSTNYVEYTKDLFNDVKLDAMLVDDGYSEMTVEHAIPQVDIDEFRKFVGREVYRVTRLEPLIKNCLDKCTNFKDLMADFTMSLDTAVKKKGAVGFKSIIAYRTGLHISKTEEREARKDFAKYKKATKVTRTNPHFNIKKLRDFMIYTALLKCIDLDVPLQFHTGIGDVDIVLDSCNPINLFDLLKDEEIRHAKIVLTHAGYPYAQEASWLAETFSNVYLDISIYTFTHVNIRRRILDVLEDAPTNKVFYASDAFGIPEFHWLNAKLFKKGLARALEEMIQFGTLDETRAYEIARRILSENARGFWKTR